MTQVNGGCAGCLQSLLVQATQSVRVVKMLRSPKEVSACIQIPLFFLILNAKSFGGVKAYLPLLVKCIKSIPFSLQ